MSLLVFFFALSLQSSVPPQLIEIQSLIDRNQLMEAETTARSFLSAEPNSADGHYLLAYILFRRADPHASLSEYMQATNYREPHALDLAAMGGDAFMLEDYAAAGQYFTRSLEKDGSTAAVWYQLGRAKYNEKHFTEALDAFQRCLQLEPANARAEDYLGLSLEHAGRADEALEAYRKAVALKPTVETPYLDFGTLLAASGRAEEAIASLLRAIEIAPNNVDAHRELGKAYLNRSQVPNAQAEFEKAIALAPDQAPLHFLLAQVYRKQGLTAKAESETARYAQLTGSHSAPETPLAEARSLLEAGKVQEAEKDVRRYIVEHPQSGEAHFLLGYILFKQQNAVPSLTEYTEGAKYRKPTSTDLEVVASDYVLLKDYPDADKWFTKAVEWNPQDTLGWYYLGRTKYNENRFSEAVAAFQKCLTLKPRDVKAEDNLGLAYEGLNQIEDADNAYRTAISWQSVSLEKDPGPYLNLGSLLVGNGHAEESLPYLLQAVKLAPADFRMHRALGKAYSYLNQLEKARAALEKAESLAPTDAPIHFMLAQVYRKSGLTDKAKAESETYSKLVKP